MTALIETPHQQATTLAMTHAYKETPGVKKLAKGYKVLPKEVLPDEFGGSVLKSSFITFMSTLVIAAIVYAAAEFLNIGTLWATVIILLLGTVLWAWLMQPVFSWIFNAPQSPFVINKQRRSNLKKTRLLAAQLGSTVIPVLTEEHVTSVERVHKAMTTAAAASHVKPDARDHARLTILILKDLNREVLLLDLINNRGITTMDEIEEVLRSIEDNTIRPLQNGWL
jgi:hypothetical protein